MAVAIKASKKLIEVGLPLIDINSASAYEKKVKVGKPTSVHHWFAPRTLTAARALIFAQMVNDPGGERGYYKGKSKKQADAERRELFDIIRELVKWENYNNTTLLAKASAIIREHWESDCRRRGLDQPLPAFLDPFCGRGVIPLEAQNLGLEVYASDLNPIPVLINQCILDYPKVFTHQVRASSRQDGLSLFSCTPSESTEALTADIEYYGKILLDEVSRKAQSLYPKAKSGRTSYPVVAWIWARTVKSPNPAFNDCYVPLISSYTLAAKGRQRVQLRPVVQKNTWRFEIDTNASISGESGTVGRRGAKCLLSGTPISLEYIRDQARQKKLGAKLIAIVADSGNGRVYLPADAEHEETAVGVSCPENLRDIPVEHWPGCTNCVVYGYVTFL